MNGRNKVKNKGQLLLDRLMGEEPTLSDLRAAWPLLNKHERESVLDFAEWSLFTHEAIAFLIGEDIEAGIPLLKRPHSERDPELQDVLFDLMGERALQFAAKKKAGGAESPEEIAESRNFIRGIENVMLVAGKMRLSPTHNSSWQKLLEAMESGVVYCESLAFALNARILPFMRSLTEDDLLRLDEIKRSNGWIRATTEADFAVLSSHRAAGPRLWKKQLKAGVPLMRLQHAMLQKRELLRDPELREIIKRERLPHLLMALADTAEAEEFAEIFDLVLNTGAPFMALRLLEAWEEHKIGAVSMESISRMLSMLDAEHRVRSLGATSRWSESKKQREAETRGDVETPRVKGRGGR